VDRANRCVPLRAAQPTTIVGRKRHAPNETSEEAQHAGQHRRLIAALARVVGELINAGPDILEAIG
jgi:hypothetical protein